MFKGKMILMLTLTASLLNGSIPSASADSDKGDLIAQREEKQAEYDHYKSLADKAQTNNHLAVAALTSIRPDGAQLTCSYYMKMKNACETYGYNNYRCTNQENCIPKMEAAQARVDSTAEKLKNAEESRDQALGELTTLNKQIGKHVTIEERQGRGGSVLVTEKFKRDPKTLAEILGTPSMRFWKQEVDFKDGIVHNRTIKKEDKDSGCTYTLSGNMISSSSTNIAVTDRNEWFLDSKDDKNADNAFVLLKSDEVKGASLKIEGTSENVVKCMIDHGFKPGKVDEREYRKEVKNNAASASA